MLVKAIERQAIAEIKENPKDIKTSEILSIFNVKMKELLNQDESGSSINAGFDGLVLLYDKSNQTIKFSSAQLPLFIIQDDKIEVIKGDRHSIGYRKSNKDFEFKEHTIDISNGSSLYISTDGYTDQTGGKKGFMFGKKRFEALLDTIHKLPLNEQKAIFEKNFEEYRGECDRKDDVTLIGLKF
jgi:serine phosphatase RsbU (regulator of sigma subunit)